MGWVTDWWTHCVCDSAWLKRTISKAINLNIVISAIRPEKKLQCFVIDFFLKSELINKWSLEAEPETRWFSKWVVRMAKYLYKHGWTGFIFFGGGGMNFGREMKYVEWHMRLSHLPGLLVDSGEMDFRK